MQKKGESSMRHKVSFIIIGPKTNPEQHRADIITPEYDLFVRGVSTFDQAVQMAPELVDEGVELIELCAGFAGEPARRVAEAVKGRCKVGVITFDLQSS